jgi:lincosamide nucleotidyltransferase A/C/D/E
MEAGDVLLLYRAFDDAGAPVWVMGGWGVDALLGKQTRQHHDLDVLIEVAHLERLRLCLVALGFALAYTWDDEVWWVRDDHWSSNLEQPTAFVYRHDDGREVDVHVIRMTEHGEVQMLWNAPYAFQSRGLRGAGSIAGHAVRCLSLETQLRAHTGYALPLHHLQDVKALNEFAG